MKTIARWGFFAVAVILLAAAVIATWGDFVDAMQRMSWPLVVAAFSACLVALGINALSWRSVLAAVGLSAPLPQTMRVFFISQAGKYVPGAVWPVLAQAEFAHDYGVSRARALTGSLTAMVVGVVTSAIVGAVGLIASSPDALVEYWWVLAVAAALALLLVPPVLTRVVRLAFRVTRRADEPVRIGAAPMLASAGWSLLMWALLGLHAWLLLTALAPGADYLHAAGAFAFAWLVGFVVVIAPAGVGAREVALVVALGAVTSPAHALSLAIISRFLMTAADAAGLLIGATMKRTVG